MKEPQREHLPDTRDSKTAKVCVANHEFYITVGFYPEEDRDRARIAEMFVKASKHGSDTSLFTDAWATMVSVALQYGVPWSKIRDKFLHSRGATFDDKSTSFLHAIVQAADSLIEEYRVQTQVLLEECRSIAHEQENQKIENGGTGSVLLQPAPDSQEKGHGKEQEITQ